MSFEKVYDENSQAMTLKGRYRLVLEAGGVVKQIVETPNVVCTNGKEFIASFLYSAAVAASTFTCKYMAIGTDTTAESAAQTALGTELARQTGTVSYVSNQMYVVTATFPSGTGTGSLAEFGLFSSNSAGTMLSRTATSTVLVKGANDSLTAVLQVTLS